MVTQTYPDKSPEAMRQLARKRWDAHVAEIVAAAPPLSDEQVQAIAAILRQQVGRAVRNG